MIYKILAILEIIIVFIGVPLLYKYDLIPVHKSIPLLAVFAVYLFILIRSKTFDKKRFGINSFKDWKILLIRAGLIILMLIVIVIMFDRESLFYIVKNNMLLWAVIMIFYPLWSAYPQELIYRAYFFYRFKALIKNKYLMILLNAALFSFSHIIFNNWIALLFTFIVSILFAYTYLKSKSLLVVFFEHALYGNMIFTIGLGEYFYLPLG